MNQRRFIQRTAENKQWGMDEWEGISLHLEEHRKNGLVIVLTCGCFDLLHVGHVRLLQEAADLGDILVVGLNSDESVRRLKGQDRPIIPGWERREMVAALEGVNFVTWFNEDDPRELIRLVKPNLYVKGGDYTKKELPERDVVTENGGQVVFASYCPGCSTTLLLGQIRGVI